MVFWVLLKKIHTLRRFTDIWVKDKHYVILTPEGLLVCFDSLHPCQQFFSLVRRCLPGLSTKQGIKLCFLIILTFSILAVTFVVC